jgi:hypothetical protein
MHGTYLTLVEIMNPSVKAEVLGIMGCMLSMKREHSNFIMVYEGVHTKKFTSKQLLLQA